MSKNLSDIEKLEAIAKVLDFDFADYELTDEDLLNQYDEMIDECNETPKVGNCEMRPSKFLEENDPIAYRCGFVDWLDSERDRIFEIGGAYVDEKGLDNIKEAISDLIQDFSN